MKIAKKFGITFDRSSAMNPGLCVDTQCHVLQVDQMVNGRGRGATLSSLNSSRSPSINPNP